MEIVMAFAVFVASCASLDAFMRVICRATYQLHHLHSINWPQEILIKFFCFAKRQNMQWDAIHLSLRHIECDAAYISVVDAIVV